MVKFDCPHGATHFLSDCLIAVAFQNKLQYFLLGFGQFESRGLTVIFIARKSRLYLLYECRPVEGLFYKSAAPILVA
jgi:hypothetical protein